MADLATVVEAIEIEEGIDFEIEETQDYNFEGTKKIRSYYWHGLDKFICYSSDYSYEDRDECVSDAEKVLSKAAQELAELASEEED